MNYIFKFPLKRKTRCFPDALRSNDASKPWSTSKVAKGYVTKDRAADHGDMEDNFQRIALYWNAHLGLVDFIKTEDVAAMMALLKIARIHSNPTHIDNWVDACGYMACGGEVVSK